MRKFLAVFAAFMLGSTPTYSEDKLEALESVDQGRAYQAIGRLDIAGSGFCTGTLISLDLVLTAAHCVYNSETKERIPASEISFKPGLRNGRAAAYRSVRRVAVHPDYDYDGTVALDRVATDLALIELSQPIRQSGITPIIVERNSRKLKTVSLVSYAKDREHVPSLQSQCNVLDRERAVQVLSCDVDFGASGSPVFVTEDGVPRIVSVVSAKSMWRNERVALAVTVGSSVESLRNNLRESDGVFTRQAPTIKKLTGVRAMQGAGAKFLRP